MRFSPMVPQEGLKHPSAVKDLGSLTCLKLATAFLGVSRCQSLTVPLRRLRDEQPPTGTSPSPCRIGRP
jgi:hypothetical protein